MKSQRTALLLLAATALCALPARAAGPAPNGHTPRLVNLKNMSCEDFIRLEEGERNPVIFYLAGDDKMAGRTLDRFDLGLANRALPDIWADCQRKPQANLMYVVVAYFKAHRTVPPPRMKKK